MDEFHDKRLAVTGGTADTDSLILVDEADHGVGHLSKMLCHEGRGVLHRAFSLLIFNVDGELLLQQRSASKRLWPLYWSNSCCSHPRSTDSAKINSDEILAWRWVSPEALQTEMAAGAGNFTPWFTLEWARVWRDHRAQVLDLQTELGSEGGSR